MNYKLFYIIFVAIWLLDISNVGFMSFLDDPFPINTLGWFLLWFFVPPTTDLFNRTEGSDKE